MRDWSHFYIMRSDSFLFLEILIVEVLQYFIIRACILLRIAHYLASTETFRLIELHIPSIEAEFKFIAMRRTVFKELKVRLQQGKYPLLQSTGLIRYLRFELCIHIYA